MKNEELGEVQKVESFKIPIPNPSSWLGALARRTDLPFRSHSCQLPVKIRMFKREDSRFFNKRVKSIELQRSREAIERREGDFIGLKNCRVE